MTNLNTSLIGVYLEVTLYVIVTIIVLSILIIELSQWYSSTKAKETETNVTNTMELSFTSPQTASKPSTDVDSAQKSDKTERSKHLSISISSNSDNPSVSNTLSLSRVLPICVYVSYLCNLHGQVFGRLAVGINYNCKYLPIGGFFYMFAKGFLYLMLLHRLYKVYHGSIFEKKASIIRLKIAAVFTVFFALLIAVLNVITIRHVIVMIEGKRYCTSVSPNYLVLMVVIYDFAANIGCCYAFTRPLLWLSKLKKGSHQSNQIYEGVVRYTVLAFVTVTSTFLFMAALILLQFNDIVFIDNAINCVCVMLFNKGYTRFYYCLCCGPHTIAHRIIQMKCCCGRRESDAKDETNTDEKDETMIIV